MLKDLIERKKTIAAKLVELGAKAEAENRLFNDEENKVFEDLEKEYNEVKAELRKAQVHDTIADIKNEQVDYSSLAVRSKITPESGGLALQGWARHQSGLTLSNRHQNAIQATGLSLNQRQIDIPLSLTAPKSQAECRALSAVTGASGAFTIGSGFSGMLEAALLFYGGIREAVSVWRTPQGNEVSWPCVNDSSSTGRYIGENVAVSETDVAFTNIIFRAHKYSSDLVRVPSELLEDQSIGNFESELARLLGERLGRKQNSECTVGSSPINGLVNLSVLGKTAAGAAAITADEIKDLIQSVNPEYRKNGKFMMHDAVRNYVWKLKDSNGRYMFDPGPAGGGLVGTVPDTLCGYPVVINNDMASTVATTNKTILFGDMSKGKLREVNSIRLVTLNERYADLDQTGFVAFMRYDFNLLDAGTNPVKYLQQA